MTTKHDAALTQTVYVAVRRCDDDGHLWVDTQTLRLLPELTYTAALTIDTEIPGWAKHNPVVKVCRSELTLGEAVPHPLCP